MVDCFSDSQVELRVCLVGCSHVIVVTLDLAGEVTLDFCQVVLLLVVEFDERVHAEDLRRRGEERAGLGRAQAEREERRLSKSHHGVEGDGPG